MPFLVKLALAVSLAVAALAPPAVAETYPDRPIRYVVPFPPGATSDNVSRVIAQRLSEVTGVPVVVENKPGAGTALGAEIVAKSDPDGYTLLNVTNATLAAVMGAAFLEYTLRLALMSRLREMECPRNISIPIVRRAPRAAIASRT